MRLFEIYRCGDPYSSTWDCSEFLDSYDEPTATYRGDLAHRYFKDDLIRYLRTTYPGCKIRERN